MLALDGQARRYRLGVDIGGTFTDLVLVDDGGAVLGTTKLLTTPRDLAAAVVEGASTLMRECGAAPTDIECFVHATTQTSNTVIERTGARTALVTTRGFRDILEFGRENRYDLYDLFIKLPEPLVPRPLRFEVTERLSADGAVITPIAVAELTAIAEALRREKVEAVAVSFLHAHRYPQHERAARDALRTAGFAGPIVLSAEICPEIREFERTATTVANAYLMPRISSYLDQLDLRVKALGVACDLQIFSSYGGRIRLASAHQRPIELLECGAAAGVLSSAMVARKVGSPAALSFDMGGTTAKAAIIQDGQPALARRYEIARTARFMPGSGLPVVASAIDIIEIGAGGGSIARVGDLGLITIGPDSAGSEPGPACYGRGGDMPTVTDANLVLGYLDPRGLLAGAIPLSMDAARAALQKHVAGPLGISVESAAASIYSIVVESMARAARMHALEHGHDPRSLMMIAFGGAGPVHAAAVAQRLELAELLVMPDASVGSALGLAVSAPAVIVAQSNFVVVDDLDWGGVARQFAAMEDRSAAELGVADRATLTRRCSADMRYSGQGHEVDVPFVFPPYGPDAKETLLRNFLVAYRARYGRDNPDARAEVVSWRLELRGPDLKPRPAVSAPLRGLDAAVSRRRAHVAGAIRDVPIYERSALPPGKLIDGPALVAELQTTTIVPEGARFWIDEFANLRIALETVR